MLVGLSTLSLSNQYITSLEGLGVQPGLRTLFLQDNFLASLDYLFTQPVCIYDVLCMFICVVC